MKALVVAALLLVGSNVAVALETARSGQTCWYGGKEYSEGEQIQAGYVDELGEHLATWTCRDGRWQ